MFYRSPISVARFDISGKYVFAGTANGMLLVFNTRTKLVRIVFFLCHTFGSRIFFFIGFSIERWLGDIEFQVSV